MQNQAGYAPARQPFLAIGQEQEGSGPADHRVRAERMKLALELCYSAKNFYINPRGKFITIKIDNPRVKDRANLALLEEDYAAQGITKIVTAQGITYRIPKK